MDFRSNVQAGVAVAVGSALYLALLFGIYSAAPYSDIPRWWFRAAPRSPMAVSSWFALVDVCGALLAALPVAAFLHLVRARRIGSAIGIGAVAALWIGIGGLVHYGVPTTAASGISRLAQFIAVLLSVAVARALMCGRKPV